MDPGTKFLIPVAASLGGGVILVGQSFLVYAGGTKPATDARGAGTSNASGAQITESVTQTTFVAWGRIDDTRILLADVHGTLHLLQLEHAGEGRVTALDVRRMGEITFASCISYLDHGKAFVGSQAANSQIVQLLNE